MRFALDALPTDLLDGVRIAALGPATAAALHSAGLAVDLVPEGDNTSESLLRAPELIELRQLRRGKTP